MDLNAFPFDLNEEPLFDLNEEPLFDLNQELHDLNGEEENFATGEESNTHITGMYSHFLKFFFASTMDNATLFCFLLVEFHPLVLFFSCLWSLT